MFPRAFFFPPRMWLTRPTYPGQSPPGLIGYPSPSSLPSRRPRSPAACAWPCSRPPSSPLPCCRGGALRRPTPPRLPGAERCPSHPPCYHGGALRRPPPRRLPGAVGKKRCEGPRVAHRPLQPPSRRIRERCDRQDAWCGGGGGCFIYSWRRSIGLLQMSSSSLGRGWVCRSAQRAGASACATCRGASPPSGTLDTAASTPPPLSCMRCVGRRRCDGTAGHKRRTG